MIQDGGMILCDAKTNVSQEDHGIVIRDVVNVPNLFLEDGTSDSDWKSQDDDRRSIPTVGNDHDEYVVTDLARAKPRKTIVGGAQVFPIGTTVLSALLTTELCVSLVSACLPLTEG
ncbi:MAG: hypothetical protein GY696_20065, partial [Gammaproteobacteria bacterium]|nr:hypothetical protein [Gammaproteobacteria bacterium]